MNAAPAATQQCRSRLQRRRDSTACCTPRWPQPPNSASTSWRLHVHHGLSVHADAWLAHCDSLCRRWAARGKQLAFATRRLTGRPERGESVEAWRGANVTRALRELALEHGVSIVLLAHHEQDQAETFLLQALRGAGVAGLAAMPRQVERDGVVWARPWLRRDPDEIAAYVRRHRLTHIDDDSNADPRFARKRLRLTVWPSLRQCVRPGDARAGRQRRVGRRSPGLRRNPGRDRPRRDRLGARARPRRVGPTRPAAGAAMPFVRGSSADGQGACRPAVGRRSPNCRGPRRRSGDRRRVAAPLSGPACLGTAECRIERGSERRVLVLTRAGTYACWKGWGGRLRPPGVERRRHTPDLTTCAWSSAVAARRSRPRRAGRPQPQEVLPGARRPRLAPRWTAGLCRRTADLRSRPGDRRSGVGRARPATTGFRMAERRGVTTGPGLVQRSM